MDFLSFSSVCFLHFEAEFLHRETERSSRPVFINVSVSRFSPGFGPAASVWSVSAYFPLPASCVSVGGAVHGSGGDSLLAMYTFTVGPWLPTAAAAAISAGLVHIQIRPTHWLPLCLPLRSNKPRRSPLCPCNCGLKLPSACSRCAHTCRRSRWPGVCRRG